jgi:hypothetical protein
LPGLARPPRARLAIEEHVDDDELDEVDAVDGERLAEAFECASHAAHLRML